MDGYVCMYMDAVMDVTIQVIRLRISYNITKMGVNTIPALQIHST